MEVVGEAGSRRRADGGWDGVRERGQRRLILGLVVLGLLVGSAAGEVATGSSPSAAVVKTAPGVASDGGGEDASCNTTEERQAQPNVGKAALLIAAFEALKEHPLGWFGFIFLLTGWTTCALPVTPLEVCAGFVFGPVWGTLGSLLAKTMGCVCAMFIGRFLGASRGWKVPKALDKYISFLLTNPLQVPLPSLPPPPSLRELPCCPALLHFPLSSSRMPHLTAVFLAL